LQVVFTYSQDGHTNEGLLLLSCSPMTTPFQMREQIEFGEM
jgi:hypothetical protein